jgi:hypothetical protein
MHMAAVGIAEAARLAGVAQSTIHRALVAGRLSYSTDPAGKRRVDVAELERIFTLKTDSALSGNGAHHVHSTDSHLGAAPTVQAVVDAYERTIARQDEAIRDLRERLTAAESERRQLSERIVGLLTRHAPGSVPAVAPRISFWKRWFR